MENAPIENCNSTTEDAAVWDFLLFCYSTVIPTSNVIKGLKKPFYLSNMDGSVIFREYSTLHQSFLKDHNDLKRLWSHTYLLQYVLPA